MKCEVAKQKSTNKIQLIKIFELVWHRPVIRKSIQELRLTEERLDISRACCVVYISTASDGNDLVALN